MKTNPRGARLFAGVDNLSLDKRNFDPSRDDIERICLFFSIGKLRHYEKEKGISVSHSNFFVHAATSHGEFALKFYPKDTAKTTVTEYAINRILIAHHFQTPAMHAGEGDKPFLASNDRLATCYSYINGVPVWQLIKERNIPRQINAAMLSLKNILSLKIQRIALVKQEGLTITINALAKNSRTTSPYEHKKTIDASLRDIYQTYQQHKSLFTRQRLHNNTNLTNFLVYKKTVHLLDLSHIREDYILSDLASLVISCLFFNVSGSTIKTIIRDYFTQHKMGTEYFPVLSTLVKVGLVKEYLKNIHRERSVGLSVCGPRLKKTFLSHLSARQGSIIGFLQPDAKDYLT